MARRLSPDEEMALDARAEDRKEARETGDPRPVERPRAPIPKYDGPQCGRRWSDGWGDHICHRRGENPKHEHFCACDATTRESWIDDDRPTNNPCREVQRRIDNGSLTS